MFLGGGGEREAAEEGGDLSLSGGAGGELDGGEFDLGGGGDGESLDGGGAAGGEDGVSCDGESFGDDAILCIIS